jgi:coenzyme F420 hydrogenase subunit beta
MADIETIKANGLCAGCGLCAGISDPAAPAIVMRDSAQGPPPGSRNPAGFRA